MKWLSLIALLLICACTPEKKLRRILSRHPELIRTDTIWQRDTTIIKEIRADTVFSNSSSRDTIVLQKDRLTIRYYHTRDSVYLQGECAGDTIYKDRPVYVNTVQSKDEDWPLWLKIVIVIVAGLIGGLLAWVAHPRTGRIPDYWD